jgi:predicted Rossmann fold nucleotide-binding protein DprA/Smf involved in DNA uptake
MKEVELLLNTLADGLKSFARAVEAVAEKVEEVAQTPEKQGPAGPSKKTRTRTSAKKKAPKPKAKAAAKGKAKPTASRARTKSASPSTTTAAAAVMGAIDQLGGTADTKAIRSETGFDAKKVQNVLYKLKKAGKVSSPKKGVYKTV